MTQNRIKQTKRKHPSSLKIVLETTVRMQTQSLHTESITWFNLNNSLIESLIPHYKSNKMLFFSSQFFTLKQHLHSISILYSTNHVYLKTIRNSKISNRKRKTLKPSVSIRQKLQNTNKKSKTQIAYWNRHSGNTSDLLHNLWQRIKTS